MNVGNITDGARTRIRQREQERAELVNYDRNDMLRPVATALEGRLSGVRSPLDAGIAIKRGWLFEGVVAEITDPWAGTPDEEEDRDLLFYLPNDDEPWTAYIVGPCPHCRKPTPLDPPINLDNATESMGEALILGNAVDAHVCRSENG